MLKRSLLSNIFLATCNINQPICIINHMYPKIVGYYASWSIYDRNFQPTDVAVSSLTHINYAFAKIEEGKIALGDPWADAEKPYEKNPEIKGSFGQFNEPNGPIKTANPNLKVLISVGGWSFSQFFSDVAATPEAREIFSESVVEFLIKYKFDGVDIDWEFPVVQGHEHNIRRPEDGKNFSLLLYSLRCALDRKMSHMNQRFLLTLATSASSHSYQHIELGTISQYVDWFNVMTYDFTGPWSEVCHSHTNLYPDPENPGQLSAVQAINDYLSAGVQRQQLVLGVPFYGRGFSNISIDHHRDRNIHSNIGLGMRYQGHPEGKAEEGVFQYHDLCQDHLNSIHGTECSCPRWHRIWNDNMKSVHLWDSNTKELISFDDKQSLAWKCHYIKQNNLGGMMIWELYGDHKNELLNSIVQGFSC